MSVIRNIDDIPDDIENELKENFEIDDLYNSIFYKYLHYEYHEDGEEYNRYIETLDAEDVFGICKRVAVHCQFLVRNNLFLKYLKTYDYDHDAFNILEKEKQKYEETSIPNYLVSFSCVSYHNNSDRIRINTAHSDGNILLGFSLKRYDVGDRFKFYYGGLEMYEFTLTEELRNTLIMPIQNEYPCITCKLSPVFIPELIRVGGIFDKPFRVYYGVLTDNIVDKIRSGPTVLTTNGYDYFHTILMNRRHSVQNN